MNEYLNKIICGDCLEVMKKLPDKCVDMVLCDLPYGTTACKWDTIIPFEPLWKEYKRIIKDNGAIVLTASQPFTSALVMSNPDMFKYEWIWIKNRGSNFASVKRTPIKEHESILIFYKNSQKITSQASGTQGLSISPNSTISASLIFKTTGKGIKSITIHPFIYQGRGWKEHDLPIQK